MKLARKGKNLTKRIVSLLLVITVLVGTIIVGVVSVNADSNDRIATFIKLAADNAVTDEDVSGMTEDQLRFLGLYLSNFYIPFVTEIGTNDNEATNTSKEDMVASLQQKLAFSEEMSKALVETIFGYTRSSLQNLCIAWEYDGTRYWLSDVCYDTFLFYVSGGTFPGSRSLASNFSDYFRYCKKNRKPCKVEFGYFKGGTFKAVGDAYYGSDYLNLTVGTNIPAYSPFQIAFFKAMECTNMMDKGYGTSIFDFDTTDGDFSEIDSMASSGKITSSEAVKMTSYGDVMMVDCFGDIVKVGGNHQIVALPGAMNPFCWKTVDSNGEDDKDPAGSYLNIINGHMMTQAEITGGGGVSQLIEAVGTVRANNTAEGDEITYRARLVDEAKKAAKEMVETGDYSLGDTESPDGRGTYGEYAINFKALNDTFKGMIDEDIGYFWQGEEKKWAVRYRLVRGSTQYKVEGNLTEFYKLVSDEINAYIVSSIWQDWHNTAEYFIMPIPRGSKDNPHAVGISDSIVTSDAPIDEDDEDNFLPDLVGVRRVVNAKKTMDKVVLIDSLGAYKGDKSTEYKAFNAVPFLNENGTISDDCKSMSMKGNSVSFGNMYSDIKDGRMDIPTQASEQALSALYVTYCWACLYDSSSKKDTIGKLGYRFNADAFPDMSNNPVSLSGVDVEGTNVQLEAIQNWTYYILHPTKGFNYVRIWLTNKINHLLLGWHSDMTGTNGVGATVGITKYRSNMGYVTMPDLSEINWTNKLIQLYNDCIPFLIVILLILMLIAFIVGALNLQHAIIGLLIFAVFTLLPVPMINGAVGYSNRISQNVYGDKFTYWALVQQESYASAIDEAANATGDGNSSYENYLRTLYAENEKVYGNQGNESILVKWQAPKKMASLVLTEADAKTLGGLNDTGVKMLRGMLNNTYSGQSYVDDEDAVYMYRSYLDISNFSRYIYNSIDNKTVKYRSLASAKKTNWKSLPSDSRLNAINNDMVDYMNEGYTNGENFDQSKTFDNQIYLYVPLTSNIINDVLADYGKIKDYSNSNDMIPINADIFNFGLPQFNQSSSSFSKKWDVKTFAATGGITEAERKSDLGKELSKYSEEDFVGLASYGLYSENPYYYFSWKLYSDGLKADSTGSKEGYKKLLLQKGEGGYFYNTENNGNKELKDFMNMRGLFTYIIPYMKQCNDMVREWDDTFGIFVYDGIPTEEGHWKDMTTDEMKAKYWHNLNVTRLYCMYCPWVDVMYDCSYAKSETINVMGERVTIDDPLDPQKYPSSRPMIFSASEMADYGLSEADLTSVEKKILRCNEQFEERMYELLNYYKFSDITLNSAAAINCAFVFNNTFSENGIFTENHNIYPQSFDLSNFSYDAFLRLILSNATSESLLDASESLDNGTATGDTSGDFYERLVNRSSTITVIVMLILDVLSVYLIPAFRIFFLVAIFFAAILIVLTSAFRIEASAKFLRKVGMQFVVPLLSFFAATIGFSLVMSLFVGVGNNAVTQTGIFISLGDPVVTMLVMIALDLILLFIYWKIIKKVLKYIKGDAKAVGGFVTGVGAAAVGMVAGAVAAGAGSAQDAGRGASRRFNNWRNRKLQKKGNKSLEEIAQNGRGVPAQDGTGVESGRANERGSGRSAEYAEEAAHNRDLQKDKGETIDHNKAEDSEERKAEIDAKAENGNIEGSETSSNDLSNGRKNDKVDSKHLDAVSDKEFSARDKVSERASGGNTVGNKSQEGAHRGGKTPREKVGSGSGYSADDYDRAQARKKGIPSTKKEGSAAVKSNSGLDYGNRKTTFATPKNRQGNSRATDRGNKPVDSKPKREKAPSKPKDHRINGGK